MSILNNGKHNDSLNSLRYKKFMEKISTNTVHVVPQSLPPTSAAAKFHSLRVFYQICQWKGSDADMTPKEWGWKDTENGWAPIPTDRPPAPEELLKIRRCGCTSECNTLRCTCKKNGLKCSITCTHCKGTSCQNANDYSMSDEEDQGE